MHLTLHNAFSKKNIGTLELRSDTSWTFQCSEPKLDAELRPLIERAMREGFRDLGEVILKEPIRFPDKMFLLRLEEELALVEVLMRG